MMKPFKPQAPKSEIYYVATKSGKICSSSYRKMDIVAWKKAFGASMWKATISYELIR